MKRIVCTTAAAMALVLCGMANAYAASVSVNLIGSPVTIEAGSSGTVSVEFTISGTTGRNGIPAITYCGTLTLLANGTFQCSSELLQLNSHQQYTVGGVPTKETRLITIVVGSNVPCPASYSYAMPLTSNAGSGLDFSGGVLSITRQVTVNVTCATVIGPLGCGHGFWKNHEEAWPTTYAAATLGDVFTLNGEFATLAGDSLMAALNYPNEPGQSKTTLGKGKILLIQAVAAVFNSVVFGSAYPFSTEEIQQAVEDAFASGDASQIMALKDAYDTANNSYCSLPVD
jgi:hypothetical protein